MLEVFELTAASRADLDLADHLGVPIDAAPESRKQWN